MQPEPPLSDSTAESPDDDVRIVRQGAMCLVLARHVDSADILAALDTRGEELKASRKATVRQVRDMVIKEMGGVLNNTLRRAKHRRGWEVARRMQARGLPVSEPLAYVTWGRLGLIRRSATLFRYLEGQRDVEVFLKALVQRGAGADTLRLFLGKLADAVNALESAGVNHHDLSGKNIFTRDGECFTVIDLDAAELDTPYTDELRLKNQIQLYDSFCDLLNDSFMVPFIERMLRPEHDSRVWMPRVRKGQEQRRRKIEERWTREGKPSRHMGGRV